MSGKYHKVIVSCLFWCFLVAASAQVQSKPIGEVSPEEIAKGTLVDVRTPEEFANGHLEDAVNIDWKSSDFRDQVRRIPRDKPLFLYCHKGGRSARAAVVLDSLGYEVIDLLGGYEAYLKEQ